VLSMAEHPLPALVAAGVTVSINSDDPPMFSTTLNHEYEVAAQLLRLDAGGVADLARAAVRASFLDAAGRDALLAEIDGYAADRDDLRAQPPAGRAGHARSD
jgi:adenosine deaminase